MLVLLMPEEVRRYFMMPLPVIAIRVDGLRQFPSSHHSLTCFRARSFDAVVANMAFMDIPDHESAMKTCIACLKTGGRFVFSLQHPCFEEPGSAWPGKGYVEVREYLQEHVRQQPIGSLFHRPLSRYLNLVVESGCTIQRIIEPQIERDVAGQIGNDRDLHVPSSSVIAATRL